MGVTELILIAVGLSMDAFAVAICRSVEMRRFRISHALIIALFFGGFQALMPLIGYLCGSWFADYITKFDHWIAFVLLAIIGGKMLLDGIRHKDEEETELTDSLNFKQLFFMAVATSIDALAVGITFAFLNTNIVVAVSAIGCITFALSLLGVYIGNKIGTKFNRGAEILGGIVLIGIGIKILIEHLVA